MIIEPLPRYLPRTHNQYDGISCGSKINLRSTIKGYFLGYKSLRGTTAVAPSLSSTHRPKSATIHIISATSNLKDTLQYGQPCYLAFPVRPNDPSFPAYLLSPHDSNDGLDDIVLSLNYHECTPDPPIPTSQWIFYPYVIDGSPVTNKFNEKRAISIKSPVYIQSRTYGKFLSALPEGDITLTSNLFYKSNIGNAIWNIILSEQPVVPSWLNSTFPQRLLSSSPIDPFILNRHKLDTLNKSTLTKSEIPFNKTSSTNFGTDAAMQAHLVSTWPLMNRDMKEKILLSDLLWCLMGSDGLLISIEEIHNPDSSPIYQSIPTYTIKLPPFLDDNTDNISEDTSLKAIVLSILTVSCHYRTVNKFLELNTSFSHPGKILQAFCSSINRIIGQFWQHIAKLESQLKSGSLSLQSLRILIQPSLATFRLLHSLVDTVYSQMKTNSIATTTCILHSIGTLLSELAIGDVNRQICEFLLHHSSMPLCQMVEDWIYNGKIDDNFEEFFITKKKHCEKDDSNSHTQNINFKTEYLESRQFFNALTLTDDGTHKENYWESNFSLIYERVPFFLKSFCEKIFLTGKYLNVIEMCKNFQVGKTQKKSACTINSNIEASDIEHTSIRYSPDFDDLFFNTIQKTYEMASEKLITCFFEQYDLIGRLYFMKSFFLLSKSDFLTTFLDNAENELDKHNASISQLDSILDMSIRVSSCGTEKYKDDVFVVLHEVGAASDTSRWLLSADENRKTNSFTPSISTKAWPNDPMNYLTYTSSEAFKRFTLWYSPQWPLNLFFNEKSIFKYQLIFRLLTHFKWVERKLHDVWRDHMMCKEVISLSLRDDKDGQNTHNNELRMKYQLLSTINVREKMLHFCKNFIFYSTVEVIEPSFNQLINELKNSKSFDQMLDSHTHFLDYVLQKCLLTDGPLLAILTKVLSICHIFSRHVLRLCISKIPEIGLTKLSDSKYL